MVVSRVNESFNFPLFALNALPRIFDLGIIVYPKVSRENPHVNLLKWPSNFYVKFTEMNLVHVNNSLGIHRNIYFLSICFYTFEFLCYLYRIFYMNCWQLYHLYYLYQLYQCEVLIRNESILTWMQANIAPIQAINCIYRSPVNESL